MINFFKQTMQDKSLKQIPKLEVGCWVNVFNPSDEEISYLIEDLNLDKNNIESGLDVTELPRVDFIGEDMYIFTKIIPDFEKSEVETHLIVIAKNFILTLSKSRPPFIDKIGVGEMKFITTQKLKCLINLLALNNDNLENSSMNVVKRMQAYKKLVELKERDLNILLEQEDFLNKLASSYHYMNLLYGRIRRRVEFFEQDNEIIEDLIIEAVEGVNLCTSSLKTISNIRNYYVVYLSNKLNRTITILTVFTIILSFATVVSGLFGMNVPLPLQEHAGIFYYLVGIVLVVCGGVVVYLKKRDII